MNLRPNFHFSPNKHWMNDPNGLFYLNGIYHLFFQYHPGSTVWGPMHWGHAISHDLIKWEEQPIALYPDDKGYIFSGSAVVDHHNTCGFGSLENPPIVAIFTYHDHILEAQGMIGTQSQALAYSLDEGITWTKYSDNPVLTAPNLKDFRDPKVFWHDQDRCWVMVLSTYEKSLIYTSKDLKSWNFESDFGEHYGAHKGVWECPDMFPLQVEDTDEEKWIVLQSLNPGHVNGGSGTQYFVGHFDGKSFTLDENFKTQLSRENALWLDYGRDNYASVSWSNIPESDGRRLSIGWMSNWDYANQTPTDAWRNAMTLPRELILRKINDDYILTSRVVDELNTYKKSIDVCYNHDLKDSSILLKSDSINLNSCALKLRLKHLETKAYSFKLINHLNETLEFGLDLNSSQIYIDRSCTGLTEFSKEFIKGRSNAPLRHYSTEIMLEIIIDHSSLELFLNDGEVVMTELFYLNEPFERFEVISDSDSKLKIELLEAHEIRP